MKKRKRKSKMPPPVKNMEGMQGIFESIKARTSSSRLEHRSTEPVQFRAVVDLHDGGGYRPLSHLLENRYTAELAAELAIKDGEIPFDATVVVESSFTDRDGNVTWHVQNTVRRPRGKKWKEYCDTHELCPHCGHIVEKAKHENQCGE